MTTYLTIDEAVLIIGATLGEAAPIRDPGLLASALARPSTSLFGEEVYPDLHVKAAALLQSVTNSHALVDGNKRAGFACAVVFLFINGSPLTLSQEAAYELVLAVADGTLADLEGIAHRLRG